MTFFKENIEIARLHLDRLKKAKQEINEKNIIENLNIDDFETIKIVDTFIFKEIFSER